VSAATTGPQWGLSFSYDGFGNRLSQTVTKGNGPTSSLTVDGATNRISGYGYDANGNTTSTPSLGTIGFDIENRITTVLGETYGYAPDNKRVYKRKSTGVEEVFYYGVGGQRLGVYTPKTNGGLQYFELTTTWQYFAGRRLQVMEGFDAHRVFAWEFQDTWNKLGIAFNDVSNGAWWASGPHNANRAAYSNAWRDWIAENRTLIETDVAAAAAAARAKAKELANSFGFIWQP